MFSLSALALVALLSVDSSYALWPRPTTFSAGTSVVRLAPGFNIQLPNDAPSDLKAAADRAKDQLRNDKLERLVVGRGSGDADRIKSARELPKVELRYDSAVNKTRGSIQDEATAALGTRDESYVLTVPADGSAATISANSSLGLFRGLTTFTQMWYVDLLVGWV